MNKYIYMSFGIALFILFNLTFLSAGEFLYGYVTNYNSIVLGQMIRSSKPSNQADVNDEVVWEDYRVKKGVYLGDLNESISDHFYLSWPVKGNDWVITQCYSEEHPAIDIADYRYPKVLAAADGKVILADCLAENCPEDGEEAKYDEGLAHTVMIEHSNGFITVYGHLKEIYVVEGEDVLSRDVIGIMGKSGKVDIISDTGEGVHLHFALLEDLNWTYLNPVPFLENEICVGDEPDIETTYGDNPEDPQEEDEDTDEIEIIAEPEVVEVEEQLPIEPIEEGDEENLEEEVEEVN